MQIKVSEGGHVFSYFGPVGFSIVVHCPRRFLVHYWFYECVYRKDAKCHSMRVTRHQHHKQILFDYSLHNQTLENVQSAKYLGITITDNMDWGQHVSEISSKATKTLGFLRRNLAFAPRSTKEVAYKTLVRPKLEYAAPIWSPHLKLQINQIEKVQRTAAHWTCRRWRNTSSVGEMLDELDWPSLEARRDQSSLLLFHKIHCGAVSIEKVSGRFGRGSFRT